ncbi:hypothetical protein [Photobacterium leiognathi]|uniref:hypothetical protein n=1 Tax=Photobacterium leiognathi TaxID=553611 RepID=UPI00273A4A97|nr:hypothetical protein [Photobacterium leiognathi]
MFKDKLPTFLLLSGVAGWIIAFLLVFKLNNVEDITELKALQDQHSIQIKDILSKEIDAVESKCKESLSIGKEIKWKGQFSLVEKYCNSPMMSGDINNMSKCKEILSECKPSKL